MKKLMLLVTTACLAACGGDDQKEMPTELVTADQPQILTYIPANSPVLITSGIYPEQYPDNYIKVMQSNMDYAVKYIEVIATQAVEAYNQEMAKHVDGDVDAETNTKLEQTNKLKAFVDKWLVEDNMNKVGFKVGETKIAIYMIDLFPVLRVQLSQDNQIDSMLNELQEQFEVPMAVSTVAGIKVRELVAENLTILIASEGDFLTISGAPTVLKDQMINQLIGSEKPATSLAMDRSALDQIKQKHGYTQDDLMLLDFQKLADYFINPSQHNSTLVNYLQIDDNMLSAVCKDELTAMIGNAPRMVAGSKELTNDTINGTFVWEMNQEIAQDMATLAGRIPHGNPNAAMAFGMSFDVKNAKDMASKYVDKIVAAPYQCEHFAALNQQAVELQAKLSQPIPPFVGNFKGFNFSLDELKLNMENADLANPNPQEMIESLKTQVFVSVDKTEALLGMAQMMVPQLQGMEIKTDGSLITLADHVPMISGKDIPLDVSHLYAAISSDTIGVSMGHEGGGDLSAKVQESGNAALMSFSATADGYKSLMEQFFALAEMPGMNEEIKQELQLQKDLTLNMIYWKSQHVLMQFNDQGFETNFNIKY